MPENERKPRTAVEDNRDGSNHRFNRCLLLYAVSVWASYVLSVWASFVLPTAPLGIGSQIIGGFQRGLYGFSMLWAPTTCGLSIYGFLRYRYLPYVLPGLISLPLVLLCWGQLL